MRIVSLKDFKIHDFFLNFRTKFTFKRFQFIEKVIQKGAI